jgi:hypothetical protein
MFATTEVIIELDGKFAHWEASITDELGEESVIGKDAVLFDDIPVNTKGDMARVWVVMALVQDGLAFGIPEDFILHVRNKNPEKRAGNEMTHEREMRAMLDDNGLEIPEA